MGSTASAHVAYGYDLGGKEDFLAEPRDEYGSPVLPWCNDNSELTEQAEALLLKETGFSETWSDENPGYFQRLAAARQQVGVNFEFSGHADYCGWILIATGSERSVDWAKSMAVDPDQVSRPHAEWDAKLAAALRVLGITPSQAGPRWLVFPSYG
jgi:hypothetical protein